MGLCLEPGTPACAVAACVRKGSSCASFAQLGLEHLTLDGKIGFWMPNLRLRTGCFSEDTSASLTKGCF